MAVKAKLGSNVLAVGIGANLLYISRYEWLPRSPSRARTRRPHPDMSPCGRRAFRKNRSLIRGFRSLCVCSASNLRRDDLYEGSQSCGEYSKGLRNASLVVCAPFWLIAGRRPPMSTRNRMVLSRTVRWHCVWPTPLTMRALNATELSRELLGMSIFPDVRACSATSSL